MSTSQNIQSTQIVPGIVFDTEFENGCIALDAPDELGNFDALDSDSVICGYNVKMVRNTGDIKDISRFR